MNPSSEIIRCFAALYPDASALEEIAEVIGLLREAYPSVRWEHPQHVHVTARFMGDTERAAALRISRAITERLHGTDEVKTDINMLGAFPNTRKPRLVWLGFRHPQPHLLRIQKRVEEICVAQGLEAERTAFTPHLTIGRVKTSGGNNDLHGVLQSCSFNPISVTFGDVRVMQSTLTPAGAIHREIGRTELLFHS